MTVRGAPASEAHPHPLRCVCSRNSSEHGRNQHPGRSPSVGILVPPVGAVPRLRLLPSSRPATARLRYGRDRRFDPGEHHLSHLRLRHD